MQTNFYTNNVVEALPLPLDGANKATNTQECFDNRDIAQFWKSISNSQREEILIIKDCDIIEKISQAVISSTLMTLSSKDATQQRAEKRTFLYNKQGKPGMILSIIEFNNFPPEGDAINETVYYMSTVVLILEDVKVTDETKSNYQVIEEKTLQEHISNIELLEKHKALLKIKYSKLENILTTFTRINQSFCHGNKKIIPESKYAEQFNLSNEETISAQKELSKKFSGKNCLTIRWKPKIYLKSVLKLFENNILDAYCKQMRQKESLKTQEFNVQNVLFQFPQQNGVVHHHQQQYNYHHPTHQHQQFMIPYAQNGNFTNINNYPSYYTTHNGYIPHQNGIQGDFTMNFFGKPSSKLVTVAHGIHFGNLAFEMRDHAVEELEFNGHESTPKYTKAHTNQFRQNGDFFNGRSKAKKNLTYTNGTTSYANESGPNGNSLALNQTQSLQNVGPLQFLLGKTSPFVMNQQQHQNQYQYQQPKQFPIVNAGQPHGQLIKPHNPSIHLLFQPQQMQSQPQHMPFHVSNPQPTMQTTKTTNSTTSIPLLETIIGLPLPGNNTSRIPNQGQDFHQNHSKFPLKATGFSSEPVKSHPEFITDKAVQSKNQDNDVINHLQEQINNIKQDELETSTTISVESGGKTSDKDSQGDSNYNPSNYSYSNSKKKFKDQNNVKFKSNGKYQKEWDRASTSNQTSDTQSRRLSDISQNFDYTMDFPALQPANNQIQTTSKDRI